MATRRDVAIKAGVSEATVSHVVNGTKFVSPELKKRVEEAITSLHYYPNYIASSMVTKKTRHVVVTIDNIKNPFFIETLEGMESVANKQGYAVSLIVARGESKDFFKTNLMDVIRRQMDGIINFTLGMVLTEADYALLDKNKIKMIDVGKDIGFNYTNSIESMVTRLKAMGHKKIGFLAGMPREHIYIEPRYKTFVEMLYKHGLEYDDEAVIFGDEMFENTQEQGYKAMKTLLKNRPETTSVFTINDLMAYGAIKAIKDSGLKIPEDISVVGCDDLFLDEWMDPALSTLRVPKLEMGKLAMKMLLSELEGEKCSAIFLDTEFIERSSTGIAKKS